MPYHDDGLTCGREYTGAQLGSRPPEMPRLTADVNPTAHSRLVIVLTLLADSVLAPRCLPTEVSMPTCHCFRDEKRHVWHWLAPDLPDRLLSGGTVVLLS